jgi:hypothetical protein
LLELRLNILLLRVKFVSKILTANFLIKQKYFFINGKNKKKNYIVKIGDILVYLLLFLNKKRVKQLNWRKLKRIRKFRLKKLRWLN